MCLVLAAILIAGMLGREGKDCFGWTPDREIHQWEQLNLTILLPQRLIYLCPGAQKANAPDLARSILRMGSDVLEAYILVESQKELIT